MTSIAQKYQEIKQYGEMGLMGHIVVGYPTLRQSHQIARTMGEGGVDFIELQIPFSDPIADGPVIMKANDRALRSGVTTQKCLDFAQRLSRQIDQPLLCMSYYNPIFSYGVERFCRDARRAGVQALIVPDMPIDEEDHEHLIRSCHDAGLHFVTVISPNVSSRRLQELAKFEDGMVYCTARQGTTGVQKRLSSSLFKELSRIRRYIKQPLAVGFGISEAKHVRELKSIADIAVIGSGLIKQIDSKGVEGLNPYLRKLKAATI